MNAFHKFPRKFDNQRNDLSFYNWHDSSLTVRACIDLTSLSFTGKDNIKYSDFQQIVQLRDRLS